MGLHVTISVLLLAVVISGVMILNAVGELVLGMSNVIDVMMSVLVVDDDLMTGALDRAMIVGETVCVTRRGTLDPDQRQQTQNCDELHSQ